MKIIIVHGSKPMKSGGMNPEFELRLKKALELDKEGGFDRILITGGASRHGVISEAAQAQAYLKDKTNTPLILEDSSRSTSENIIFSKEKLAVHRPDKVTVVVGTYYLSRTKYLYRIIWPELKTFFAPAKSSFNTYVAVREFIWRFYGFIDPWEKLWPVRLFKRFSRQ